MRYRNGQRWIETLTFMLIVSLVWLLVPVAN